jgi:hypothetical protein
MVVGSSKEGAADWNESLRVACGRWPTGCSASTMSRLRRRVAGGLRRGRWKRAREVTLAAGTGQAR